jgi:ABC-type nitrate/sulfonate/bicarbonate transport system substrate-binding protein
MKIMKALATAALAACIGAVPAAAEDVVRVGNSAATAFPFVLPNIGIEKGIFAKHGVKVEMSAFAGGGRLMQALIGDSVDMALGSGPEMASIPKGNPSLGVAAYAGPPLYLVLIVRADLPIETVKDLKGTAIGVSTAGSLTDWLAREMSRREGWGPDGIHTKPLGAVPTLISALRNKQIDGMVTGNSQAYDLEDKGVSRTIVNFGNEIHDFIIHVVYATNKFQASKPDAVRNFLAGLFETVKYTREHKAEALPILAKGMGISEALTSRVYDETMPMFIENGHFDPKALAVLARSYVDMGLLPSAPDMSKLYTEKFLPNGQR